MFTEWHRKRARMEFKANCGYTFELYLCFYMINTLLPLWTKQTCLIHVNLNLGPYHLQYTVQSVLGTCINHNTKLVYTQM